MDKNYICGVVEGFYGRPWTNEQRKHLFSLLRKFGMNTYLYAPKDDLKHRAEWRILYTAEETALLESLIRTANENGITFVYALSPGIDIVYSNAKEIKAIQDKLTQVRSLGCNAFSLLFDDIETKMNELDRKQFSSFALAQLTVANSVYEFMDCPLFFFCPTEYCESCAIPNLDFSNYLSLLGAKLNPDIHILWTGPRVVSRQISVEHLQRVSNVLRRRPMIWDNLHANDYDPKRIFMGPFVGRPVAIKNETSGLLLNPNCKYEANYIPLFTLSDWVQSDLDAPKVEEDQNAVLESTVSEEAVKVVERSRSTRLYHPLTSLRRALDAWLPQFSQGPGPAIPPLSQLESQTIAPVIDPSAVSSAEVPPPTIRTCEGNELLSDLPPPIYTSPIGHATTVCVQAFPLSEAIIGVVEAHDSALISKAPQTVNSLAIDYNESMDIPVSAVSSSKEYAQGDGKQTAPMDLDEPAENIGGRKSKPLVTLDGIDLSSVALFVDIFYLPFEHGQRGVGLLNELKWLYENALVLRTDGPAKLESEEWHRRFGSFQETSNQLTELYRQIIKSPNKSLLQEIFPYLWEAQGLISVICALLEWMSNGNLLFSPTESTSSNWNNDGEADADLEPWALGGGLLPDLQKFIVSSPKLGELFTVKFPIPLSLRCYKIRPVDMLSIDKTLLFDLFASPDERNLVERMAKRTNLGSEEMFFDQTFATFLKFGAPIHHFLAEAMGNDDDAEAASPCALALGILNVAGMVEEFKDEFLPKFREKYKQSEGLAEQMEQDLAAEETPTSESNEILCKIMPERFSTDFLSIYQSMVEICWPADANEAVSVRRLLHCLSASLALNGSTGFFTVLKSNLEERIDLLSRLGLEFIGHSDCEKLTGFTVMGHKL